MWNIEVILFVCGEQLWITWIFLRHYWSVKTFCWASAWVRYRTKPQTIQNRERVVSMRRTGMRDNPSASAAANHQRLCVNYCRRTECDQPAVPSIRLPACRQLSLLIFGYCSSVVDQRSRINVERALLLTVENALRAAERPRSTRRRGTGEQETPQAQPEW